MPVTACVEFDKATLIQHVARQMTTEVNYDAARAQGIYGPAFFNWFIDKFTAEWQTIPATRYELFACCNVNQNLQTIRNSRQRHNCLCADRYLVYAMLSVFVYRIEDETVALEGVREAGTADHQRSLPRSNVTTSTGWILFRAALQLRQ